MPVKAERRIKVKDVSLQV